MAETTKGTRLHLPTWHWLVGQCPRQCPGGADVAREAAGRRFAGDGAAILGLERTELLYHQNEHDTVSIMVPAPPLFGRRSKAGGVVLRRRAQVNDAASLRCIIERGGHAMSFSGSPGLRRAWRRGRLRASSPDFMVPAAGELSSATAPRAAPARFLLQGKQVEHGGDAGVHGEARGCPSRRWLTVSE
jgi:hypothetical protein